MSYVEIKYPMLVQIRPSVDHFTWNLFFSWFTIHMNCVKVSMNYFVAIFYYSTCDISIGVIIFMSCRIMLYWMICLLSIRTQSSQQHD